MTEGRKDRIRPSSIKLLPAIADSDVAWALDQVISRESMTQTDALAALNELLKARGLPTTTMSAFNRMVVEFRADGIPPRYRLQPPSAGQDVADGMFSAALISLIDARIEWALARRNGDKAVAR